MFVTRLISGIVLLAVSIGAIALNGPVLFAFLLAISLIGMFELYRAVGIGKSPLCLLAIISYAAAVVYYILVFLGLKDFYFLSITGALIAVMFVYVFTYPRYHAEEVMAAFFGIVYVAVCLSCIYQVRNLHEGEWLVWLIYLSAWGCDTFAYCFGMLFGRHKMAPVLSPKKSVEGAIGGVAGAAAAAAVYALCMNHFVGGDIKRVIAFAVICACGGLISMVGDLAASAIKRNHKIKDYGRLIPGHGGILDRFDSIIVTAPATLLLVMIFNAIN